MTGTLRRIVASRWYVPLVLGLWIFAPELRRLFDYFTTYHQFSIFTLLPLLSLLPAACFAASERLRLGSDFLRVAAFWGIGFGYAALIGMLLLSPASTAFALVQAVVPALFAVLVSVAQPGTDLHEIYERVAAPLLWCALLSSLYGIYQYAAPLPWDVFWAQHADIEGSQGETVAFGFRIFGTLNSTGPFSTVLALSLLLNLPRMRRSRWWLPLALAPQAIALILTSVRASWITFAIALALYIALAPRRKPALAGIAGSVAAVVAATALFFAVSSGAQNAGATFATRIQTLSDLSEDTSVNTRADQTSEIFRFVLGEPLGQGLGAIGLSAKLGSGGEVVVVDSGFIARLLEMGFPGTPFFFVAIAYAFGCGWFAYRQAARSGYTEAAQVLAVCLAVQLMFVLGQAGSDVYFGPQAMFFWFALYAASAYRRQAAQWASLHDGDLPVLKRVSAAG